MLIGLALMLLVFFFLPRWSVKTDTAAWARDPTDRYGSLWHRQRFILRGVLVVSAAIMGHVFWLWGHWAPLLEGVGLASLLGGCYFMYDFNPRLNLARAVKEPWVSEWYVSRSSTTASFDKLLCVVADNLGESTEVVLKRVVQRSLFLGVGLYLLFLVLTVLGLNGIVALF